ncbi:MAG: PAS domain S-box protein [Ignavibacteriales bacterium]
MYRKNDNHKQNDTIQIESQHDSLETPHANWGVLPRSNMRLAVLFLAVLALAAVFALMPRNTTLKQFEQTEQKEQLRNIHILIYSFDSELTSLRNLTADWGTWDEAYRFMKDQDKTFLRENINWEAMQNASRIDLVYFRDNKGQIIWGSQSDMPATPPADYSIPQLEPELVKYFGELKDSEYQGILLTKSRGPILICAAPVLPGSGQGESKGTIFMGRYLNSDYLQVLSERNQMDITLRYPEQKTFTPDERQVLDNLRLKTDPLAWESKAGSNYILMKDLRGQDYLLTFKWAGHMEEGFRAANYAYLAFFVSIALVVFVLLMAFIIYARTMQNKRLELQIELKKRSQELKASEESYAKLIENAMDPMIIYDLDYVVRVANKISFSRLGYTREELMGLKSYNIIAPENLENTMLQTERVLETGSAQYESVHMSKDGRRIPVEVSSQLIEYEGKTCILTVGRDMTTRKQAEEARLASERLYRNIFDNTPVGIVYINNGMEVIKANLAMKKIVLMERLENIYGRKLTLDMIGPDLMDMLEKSIHGEACMFEGEYNPPTGTGLLFLRVLFSPVDSDNLPTDVICILEDITERKQDESILRQLYTAIEQSPLSVVITDIQGSIQYVNKAFETLTGYMKKEVMGENPRILNARTLPKELYEGMWATVLAGRVWQGEFHNRTKQGQYFWEHAQIAPVHDENGQITNFVGVKREITRQKLIDEALSFIQEVGYSEEPLPVISDKILKKAIKLFASTIGAASIFNDDQSVNIWYAMKDSASRSTQLEVPIMAFMKETLRNTIENGVTEIFNQFEPDDLDFMPDCFAGVKRFMVVPIKTSSDKIDALVVLADKLCDYTEIDAEIAALFFREAWVTVRRRLAEYALREIQQRAEAVFEAVQAGIVLIGVESGRVVDANPAALSMYGGNIDDIKGLLRDELFSNTLLEDEMKGRDKEDWSLLTRLGERMPILKTVAQVMENGREYLLISFVDLSERLVMEEELRKAKDAAEAAYTSKSMFLANMSHEIRTPMNAVLGYAQLIKRDPNLSDQQRRSLDIIANSGNYLLKIINDILEMAKMEAGRISMNEENCNFDSLLVEIEDIFRLPCQEKGIMLIVERVHLAEKFLKMDVGKVRQVLINLIGNALKFTDEGGIVLRVDQIIESNILWDSNPLMENSTPLYKMKIEVEDTGYGIPLEKTSSIFEVFEQAHNSANSIGGTGLGLAISRNFARLMGGDLELIRSEVGRGSLFGFTFVASQGEFVLGSDMMSECMRVRSVAPDRNWKVLVVDDLDTNRDLLVQLLLGVGFQVRKASDGLEGIRECERWKPDIVLMDLIMPEMSGFEAIYRIRSSPEGSKLPILAISASVMDNNELKALQAGADAFLRKPFRTGELFQTIEKLIGVKYIYQNETPEKGFDYVDAASLVEIPRNMVAAMKESVEKGDMVELEGILNLLVEQDRNLADKLRLMAEKFDYDGLYKFLDHLMQDRDLFNE